jgi:glycerol uptake facilitator protein
VTFALAVTKRFPWRELPLYWVSQVVGAIAGALAIWASFGDRAFDLGAGFGVVDFNHDVTSWGSAMFIEGLGTAILLFTVLGIVDSRSPRRGPASSSAWPLSPSSSPWVR